MNQIYIHFICAHYRSYGNAPVRRTAIPANEATRLAAQVARIKAEGCDLAESYVRSTVTTGIGKSEAIDKNKDLSISAEVRHVYSSVVGCTGAFEDNP